MFAVLSPISAPSLSTKSGELYCDNRAEVTLQRKKLNGLNWQAASAGKYQRAVPQQPRKQGDQREIVEEGSPEKIFTRADNEHTRCFLDQLSWEGT
jgi:hypothetical protein